MSLLEKLPAHESARPADELDPDAVQLAVYELSLTLRHVTLEKVTAHLARRFTGIELADVAAALRHLVDQDMVQEAFENGWVVKVARTTDQMAGLWYSVPSRFWPGLTLAAACERIADDIRRADDSPFD